MKHILIIQGGGRPNGNTAQLVSAFMRGAEAAGHRVELLSLNRLQVNGMYWLQCLPVWEALRAEG